MTFCPCLMSFPFLWTYVLVCQTASRFRTISGVGTVRLIFIFNYSFTFFINGHIFLLLFNTFLFQYYSILKFESFLLICFAVFSLHYLPLVESYFINVIKTLALEFYIFFVLPTITLRGVAGASVLSAFRNLS